jgi:hypothetical protein
VHQCSTLRMTQSGGNGEEAKGISVGCFVGDEGAGNGMVASKQGTAWCLHMASTQGEPGGGLEMRVQHCDL